jgi:hypothetical protein
MRGLDGEPVLRGRAARAIDEHVLRAVARDEQILQRLAESADGERIADDEDASGVFARRCVRATDAQWAAVQRIGVERWRELAVIDAAATSSENHAMRKGCEPQPRPGKEYGPGAAATTPSEPASPPGVVV